MTQPPSEGGAADRAGPTTPSTTTVRLNPRGMRCLLCAYDLSGIPADARCPECSAEIAHTRELLLSSQPPETLHRLQWGAIVMLIGVGVQIFFGGLGSAAPLFLLPLSSGDAANAALMALAWVFGAIGLAIHAVIAWGYWRLTTPLTGSVPPEWSRGRVRAAIRVVTVIVLVIAVATLAINMLSFLDPELRRLFDPNATAPPTLTAIVGVKLGVAVGVGLLASLGEIVRYLLGMIYLGALARRVPDPGTRSLARLVVRCTIYLVLACVGIAILGFAGIIFGSTLVSSTVGAGLLGFVMLAWMLLVAVGGLTLFILWIVAYAKFASAVSRIRREVARDRALAEAAAP